MSNFATPCSDTQIFHLDAIELCVAIFRGPDIKGWSGIANTGVPELLNRIPQNPNDLTDSLKNLQGSLANPTENPDQYFDLETEYVRLFISSSGSVPAPPYESCHLKGPARTMGKSALAMRSRLSEAGLELSLDSNEPPDHLSIELEYLYHLLSTGWTDGDATLAASGADFARTVMLPWVRRFRQNLAQADPHPAYLHAANLTVAVLEEVGKP
ncbi:MAG: molecular chaperone TorD family protein [Pseudodesulfovibrio sp.]|nr:molecular chaperone TorD family protein [Pseudodesulfovibrio sp.]